MTTLTVTAKGQVTLRGELLRHLGIRPGEKIQVDKLPDGRVEVRAAQPSGTISDVFGLLKQENVSSLPIDELNEVTRRAWAGKL